MIVVSDTSVISALLRINEINILAALYGQVAIPKKVYEELGMLSAFGYDISPILGAPWLHIHEIVDIEMFSTLCEALDAGEAEAIVLAKELGADYLIIDELTGRDIATKLGLNIIGLGGVIVNAKKKGVIELAKPYFDRLRSVANFRLSEKVYQILLADANELP